MSSFLLFLISLSLYSFTLLFALAFKRKKKSDNFVAKLEKYKSFVYIFRVPIFYLIDRKAGKREGKEESVRWRGEGGDGKMERIRRRGEGGEGKVKRGRWRGTN